jgi:hypothetical protein
MLYRVSGDLKHLYRGPWQFFHLRIRPAAGSIPSEVFVPAMPVEQEQNLRWIPGCQVTAG